MPHTAAETANPSAKALPQGLSETERDQISRRAHGLWRDAGCPQGRDREFWTQAEMEILKGRRSF